jgi:hypothetical protein
MVINLQGIRGLRGVADAGRTQLQRKKKLEETMLYTVEKVMSKYYIIE